MSIGLSNGLQSGLQRGLSPGIGNGVDEGAYSGIYSNDSANYNPRPILNGLVCYLDASIRDSYSRSGGSIWKDLTGNSSGRLVRRDGVTTNIVRYTTGFDISQGNAPGIICNQSSADAVHIPWVPAHSFSNNITISVWVWSNNAYSAGKIFYVRGSSDNQNPNFFYVYIYEASATTAQTFFGATYAARSTIPTLNNGRWNNLVVTYDGSTLLTYFNNNVVGTHSQTNPTFTSTDITLNGDIYSGLRVDYAGSNKKYNQFLMYNRALTSGEILENYNRFAPRFGIS